MSLQNPQTDLDSFSESDRKFVLDLCDVFSAVKGKPLTVYFNFGSKQHFIYYDKSKDEYVINTDPKDPKVNWKTAIEHELSHFIFDTKMKTFKMYMDKILANTDNDLRTVASDMLKNTYNILEDQRIESWFGKLRSGSRNRFVSMRKNFGSDPTIVNEIPNNPINALLDARFYREDLVNQSAFKVANDFIKKSEFLDPKGSIILTKKYYDEIIHPFLKDFKEKQKQKQQSNQSGSSNQNQNSQNQNSQNQNSQNQNSQNQNSQNQNSQNQNSKDDLENKINQGKTLSELNDDEIKTLKEMREKDPKKFKELIEKAKQNKSARQNNSKGDQVNQKPKNIFEELEKKLANIGESDHKDFEEIKVIEIDLDDIKKALEKSKSQGEKDLKNLLKKLSELKQKGSDTFNKAFKRWFNILDYTNRYSVNSVKEDRSLASQLNQIFRQIQAKKKIKMDIRGSNISFKDYVNARHNSNTRVFRNELRSQGLTVYVLCDQSSSMSGSQIQLTADLLATFYKSVESFKEIKIIARGFCGVSDKLVTCKIDNFKDVGKINNSTSGTPTDLGLIEAKKDIDKINGKKFLIVLTDGEPNQMPVNDPYRYINWIIEDQFRKNNIGVFGVLIGSSNEKLMKEMFNSDYAVCENLQEAKTKITKVFEKTVRDYLT